MKRLLAIFLVLLCCASTLAQSPYFLDDMQPGNQDLSKYTQNNLGIEPRTLLYQESSPGDFRFRIEHPGSSFDGSTAVIRNDQTLTPNVRVSVGMNSVFAGGNKFVGLILSEGTNPWAAGAKSLWLRWNDIFGGFWEAGTFIDGASPNVVVPNFGSTHSPWDIMDTISIERNSGKFRFTVPDGGTCYINVPDAGNYTHAGFYTYQYQLVYQAQFDNLSFTTVTPISSPAFNAAFASSMTRVPRRTIDLACTNLDSGEIYMCKNEHEPVQLVLSAGSTAVTGVTVSCGNLTRDGGGGTISSSNISIRKVEYIEGNYNRPPDPNMFVDPAYPELGYHAWPDPLMTITGAFDVSADQSQPLWIDVYTPINTPAGTYRSQVQVQTANLGTTNVELVVHVWDFALSHPTHLRSMIFIWDGAVASYHGMTTRSPQFMALRRKYVDAYLKHRICPNGPSYYPLDIEFTLHPDDSITMDFDAFDNEMEHAMVLGLNTFQWPASILHLAEINADYAGGPFILNGNTPDPNDRIWVNLNPSWANPDDPARDRLEELSTQIANHLQKWNWLAKSAAYMVGEPVSGGYTHDPDVEDYEYTRRIFEWLHDRHAGIKNMIAMLGDQFSAAIDDNIDIWGGDTSEQWKYTAAETVQRDNGNAIWTYFPGMYRIDNQAASFRLLPWYCWKYDIKGIGPMTDFTTWFQVNSAPMSSASHQPGSFPDDFVIYPGTDGPIETTRFELLRDGMEDYEYFWKANQFLERLQNLNPSSPLIAQVQNLLFNDSRVIAGRNPLQAGQWDFPNNNLSDVRVELGNLIQQLRAALPPSGDSDGDNDVDAMDFTHYMTCKSGPRIPQTSTTCLDVDLDNDDDVDQSDYGFMQRCFSGPAVPSDPNCALDLR